MAARARHRPSEAFAYDAFEAGARYAPVELAAGERIGSPLSAARSKAMRRGGFLLVVALAGGWALLGDQAVWPDWLTAEIATLLPSLDSKKPAALEQAASAVRVPEPPASSEPPPQPAVLDPSPPIVSPPAPSRRAADTDDATTASQAPSPADAAQGSGEVTPGPLPPPAADPADPYAIRASAVGLHPDLSRVLLTRLSPADYRNAGMAVQKAVAETPDDGVFVWPRQRKPELALFQVRFVAGAAPGCRRYVVTVTKDGWLTTALPMERCGSHASRPGRG